MLVLNYSCFGLSQNLLSLPSLASNIQILGVIHYSPSHRPVITPMRPLCPAAVQCHRELKKNIQQFRNFFFA